MSATYTHLGPGGFRLYALTIQGFKRQNFDAIVFGITEAIVKADMSLAPATVRSGSAVATTANAVGVNREMALLRFDRKRRRSERSGI